MATLNELATLIHGTARVKGWWDEPRSFGDVIALCHSELSEALEEFRAKGDAFLVYTSPEGKPEGVPIELADCIIRILDFCGKSGIDIERAVLAKMEYNETRPYRHGGKVL